MVPLKAIRWYRLVRCDGTAYTDTMVRLLRYDGTADTINNPKRIISAY